MENKYKREVSNRIMILRHQVKNNLSSNETKELILVLIYLKHLNDSVENIKEYASLYKIPTGTGWGDLQNENGIDLLTFSDKMKILEDANPLYFHDVFSSFKFGYGVKTLFQNSANTLYQGISDIYLGADEINFKNLFEGLLTAFETERDFDDFGIINHPELIKLMLSFVKVEKPKIYNPFAGLGSFGVFLPKNNQYYGQELNNRTYRLARLRFFIHKKQSLQFENIDSVQYWGKTCVSTIASIETNAVVSIPPFNERLKLGESKQISSQHFLIKRSMETLPSNGVGVFLVPSSFLLNLSTDKDIRKRLVEKNWIKYVVSLPEGLLYNSGVRTSIVVIDKSMKAGEKAILVDASEQFKKGKFMRAIEFDHQQVLNLIYNEESGKSSGVAVSKKEFEENEFSFDPNRYKKIVLPTDDNSKHYYISDLLKSGDAQESLREHQASYLLNLTAGEKITFGESGSAHTVLSDGSLLDHFERPFLSIKHLSTSTKSPYIDFKGIDNIDTAKTKNLSKLDNSNFLVSLYGGDLKPTIIQSRKLLEYAGEGTEWYYRRNQIAPLNFDESKVDLHYLVLELNKTYIKDQLKKYSKGTSFEFISLKDLYKITVELPTLEEQKKQIADIKLSLLDDKEIRLETIRKTKEVSLAIDNSRIRHQIAGRLHNARSSAHSLKNIIAMQGAVTLNELLDKKESKKDRLTFKEMLDIVVRDLDVIHHVINETKVEEMVFQMNFEDFEIVPFIQNYRKELKNRKNNIIDIKGWVDEEAIKEFGGKKIFVRGDKEKLTQALDNLVENAMIHGFKNQVSPGQHISFDIMFDLDDNEVQIDVTNTGEPLPEDFDFEKAVASKSKSKNSKGTGFGLFFVNKIVENHSGRFLYTPEDGPEGIYGDKGATFEIYLPIEIL